MRILLCAGLLALVSCSPPAANEEVAAATSNTCAASASQQWRPQTGTEFAVEAVAQGPDCARAVATLTIRNDRGEVVWTASAPTAHIMVLAQAHDVAAMQAALEEWTASTNNTMTSTAALPDWPANAAAPVSGEFPFYPEPQYDRAGYMALREANVPLFCYVQGMESLGCLVYANGAVDKLGVQAFPG